MKHSAIWRRLRRVAVVYGVVRLPFEIVDDVKRFFSFLDDARPVVRTVKVAAVSVIAALSTSIPPPSTTVPYDQITSSMTNGFRDIRAPYMYDPTAIVAELPLYKIANETHSNAISTGTTVSLPKSTAAFYMTVCDRSSTITCRPF